MSERKSNLITARISADDLEILNDLSERIGKSKSDTITRAIKFWSNVGDMAVTSADDSEKWGKVLKNVKVHLRANDTDMTLFDECAKKTGLSISQIVRKAIKAYHNSIK